MRPYFLTILLLHCFFYSHAQIVNVSGRCITGTITLNKIADINTRPAYQGTGTVDASAGVTVSIYWLPTPDVLWVLDFDGQPYFQNACNFSIPTSTTNTSCPWTVVSGQVCNGASTLSITGPGGLPVTFSSFSARKENKAVILNWKTATESNNKGFEIQRSADGINWFAIGFAEGSINSVSEKSYQFKDAIPLTGKNFYRLAQVDLDNKQSYSVVVNIEVSNPDGYYLLKNNPGNGIYLLTIPASVERYSISVLDITGRRILNKFLEAGTHTIDISSYMSGTYLLRINKGSEVFTEKLIKL
jgi:Secretion system C-terminal sorting domain